MDEQARLKETLGVLLELAAASDGRLTLAQIEDACKDLGLTDAQVELVCTYLELNHVVIEDFQASDESRAALGGSGSVKSDETGTESAYYKMYLEELRSLRLYEEREEGALVAAMLAGDDEARDRLIEGNLFRVVQMSREYLGKGVLAADLVQEGNIALVMAMESYEVGRNFRIHLLTEIENAMVCAIREQTGADDVGRYLAADANALMKATEVLADELGREATVEELASYLHMSRGRVETLVRMSLDAMNLSEE